MDKQITKNEGAFMELFNRDPKEVQYVENELEEMGEFLRKSWTDEITTLNQEMKGLQDRQKQIEELANDLQEAWTAWSLSADLPQPWEFVAKILAKKWQPKIPECVVDYIENYKEGFKEGIVALKTQLEGILTQPVEMGYYKKPNKRGKVDKELLLGIVEEICKELVDE